MTQECLVEASFIFLFFIDHGRLRNEHVVSPSKIFFTKKLPPSGPGSIPALSLHHVLDVVIISISILKVLKMIEIPASMIAKLL